MKYVINAMLIVVVCLALHYFKIVNFGQLIELEPSVILDTLLPCTLFLLMVNALAAIRWVLIVNRFLGTGIDFMDGLALTFKSGLFAYFLPGQLGSELGRVILASRGRSPKDLNHALSAAIIDRVIALISMLLMAALFLAWALLRRYESVDVFVTLVGSFILVVALVPLSTKALRSVVFALKNNRYIDYVGNILKMIKTFVIEQPVYCILLLLYSMLLNLAVAYVIYLIVSRIIHPMDFSTVALMSLVSNLSSVIPITPGGVGISEIVFRETGALVQGLSVENLAGGYIMFRLLNISSYIFGMLLLGLARLIFQDRKRKN
jgi:uncharacterized protein (TIRG00374 family)